MTSATLNNIFATGTTYTYTKKTKIEKQIMRCWKCKKKIGEYYATFPFGSGIWADEEPKEPLCKHCYQLEKLKE